MNIILYFFLGLFVIILAFTSSLALIIFIISIITKRKFTDLIKNINEEPPEKINQQDPTKTEKIISFLSGFLGLIGIFIVNRYYRARNAKKKMIALTKISIYGMILLIIFIFFFNALGRTIEERNENYTPEIDVEIEFEEDLPN